MTLKIAVDNRTFLAAKLMNESNTGKYFRIAKEMLRAYLRGDAWFTDELLAEIVTAVKEEETHGRIVKELKSNIEAKLYEIGFELSRDQLTAVCSDTVNGYSEVYDDGTVTGANFDGPLQPIISSVQELNFVECHLLQSAGKRHAYACTYEIVDQYDFDNDRRDQPIYDNYRKGLAALMRDDIRRNSSFWWNSVNKFDLDVILLSTVGRNEEGIDDKGRLLASLIYAAQKNGLYKGIAWRRNIPFSFTVETASEIFPPFPNGVEPDARRMNFMSAPIAPTKPVRAPSRRRSSSKHFIPPHAPMKSPLYIVCRGDTLSGIAKKYLGEAKKWELIYKLNRSTIGLDPNVIRAGARLRIPFL